MVHLPELKTGSNLKSNEFVFVSVLLLFYALVYTCIFGPAHEFLVLITYVKKHLRSKYWSDSIASSLPLNEDSYKSAQSHRLSQALVAQQRDKYPN